MIRVGIIGVGCMGAVHLRNWQALGCAEVVAVCDINPDFGATKGNIAANSGGLNLEGVTIYHDTAEMLAAEKLDAVSVTLPTHLHKRVSIQCLEAGMHVLCEKPMALSVLDCNEMTAAAKASGKELMIAHCIRFWPEYVWLKTAVESGAFGQVKAADFSRLSYAPTWSADSWYADPSKSGGVALDLHIHDLDFIQHLFGAPASVQSEKICFESGTPGHVFTHVDYGGGKVVTATASWMMPPSYGFKMAFNVVFEKAAAILNESGLKVYPLEGEVYAPELPDGNGYLREIEYFAARVKGEAGTVLITPEQAGESVRMALETMKG